MQFSFPNSSSRNPKRIAFIDIAKGIAIVSIVVGHLAGSPEINKLVFQYHVPLFFVLAGYFLNDKRSWSEFVIQKARRLLVPYIITCITLIAAVSVFQLVFGKANPPTHYTNVTDVALAALWGSGRPAGGMFHIGPIGAIWFLEALFISLVEVYCCIRIRLRSHWLAAGAIVFLFVFSYLSAPIVWLPFNIQSGLCAGM